MLVAVLIGVVTMENIMEVPQETKNRITIVSEVNEHSCRVRLFATPWTIQSIEFSRPEYWSG